MEFKTAKELHEKGKIGDTVEIDGQTWKKTGDSIADILMPFDESKLPKFTPERVKKAYIVWNEAETEGFVTTDNQLAYEVRKGSTDNCYNENGERSAVGQAFTEAYAWDNCTIQEIEL